jgi:hypothetical protein
MRMVWTVCAHNYLFTYRIFRGWKRWYCKKNALFCGLLYDAISIAPKNKALTVGMESDGLKGIRKKAFIV